MKAASASFSPSATHLAVVQEHIVKIFDMSNFSCVTNFEGLTPDIRKPGYDRMLEQSMQWGAQGTIGSVICINRILRDVSIFHGDLVPARPSRYPWKLMRETKLPCAQSRLLTCKLSPDLCKVFVSFPRDDLLTADEDLTHETICQVLDVGTGAL